MNYLIYDEFWLETAFDFKIDEEVIYANFYYLRLSKAGDPIDRDKPIFNDIDFSSEDYAEFWSFIEIKT